MLKTEQRQELKKKSKGVSINKSNFKEVLSKFFEVLLKEDLDSADLRDVKTLIRTKKIYKNKNDINFNENEMDALLNSVYNAFIKFLNRGI